MGMGIGPAKGSWGVRSWAQVLGSWTLAPGPPDGLVGVGPSKLEPSRFGVRWLGPWGLGLRGLGLGPSALELLWHSDLGLRFGAWALRLGLWRALRPWLFLRAWTLTLNHGPQALGPSPWAPSFGLRPSKAWVWRDGALRPWSLGAVSWSCGPRPLRSGLGSDAGFQRLWPGVGL